MRLLHDNITMVYVITVLSFILIRHNKVIPSRAPSIDVSRNSIYSLERTPDDFYGQYSIILCYERLGYGIP